ncbi:hypothetical protein TeGR_g9576 [Tetraparma gracilis]|uniref:Uncharacterized protein n=1 Tax=Tetraparma gracilis TaxID=2962635 RepID=A0ABQ6M5S1_9STRA|nr:hypothetical protein TeGR_g9576 [Tetraparma gracilis]
MPPTTLLPNLPKASRCLARRSAYDRFRLSHVAQLPPVADAAPGSPISLPSSAAYRSDNSAAPGVRAWAFLVRRSNSQTTRAVQLKARGGHKPMQVVELRVLVQNAGAPGRVRLDGSQRVMLAAAGGGAFCEITTDRRMKKKVTGADGRALPATSQLPGGAPGASLPLHGCLLLQAHLNVQGCRDEAEFEGRAAELSLEIKVGGREAVLTIPFPEQEEPPALEAPPHEVLAGDALTNSDLGDMILS